MAQWAQQHSQDPGAGDLYKQWMTRQTQHTATTGDDQTPAGQRAYVTDPEMKVAPTTEDLQQAVAPKPATPSNPAPETPPPAAEPPPAYQDILDTQFGEGNPFGMRSDYDFSKTFLPVWQRELDKQLGALHAREGATGTAGSARAGLNEGAMRSDALNLLADTMLQRQEQAYQNDANRGLSAYQGAGAQNLQDKALGLQAQGLGQAGLENLGQFGKMLDAIGKSEQRPPLADLLLQMASLFSQGSASGDTSFENQGRTTTGFIAGY